jgi:sialic acid synthase SpsE
VVRKALYLARDLETGDTIDEDDLLPLRPLLDGIPARHRDEIVGRKLAKPVPAGTRLMRDDLV